MFVGAIFSVRRTAIYTNGFNISHGVGEPFNDCWSINFDMAAQAMIHRSTSIMNKIAQYDFLVAFGVVTWAQN